MEVELTSRQLEFLLAMLSSEDRRKFSMPNIFKKDKAFVVTLEDRHAMHGLYKKLIRLYEVHRA